MPMFKLVLLLTLLPLCSLNAAETPEEKPAETLQKAVYNTALDKSAFPLQDQIRFYNRNLPLAEIDCGEDEVVGIYNLREQDGALQYDCLTKYNSHCEPACFGGGISFGKYKPQLRCEGDLIIDAHTTEEGEAIAEFESCQDAHGNIIWARGADDDVVYDRENKIVMYRDEEMFISFKDDVLLRRLIYRPNEILFSDFEDAERYIHVKYVRDSENRVIRETYYNRENFPYAIYTAEYKDGKCTMIHKINGYNGAREEYLFE